MKKKVKTILITAALTLSLAATATSIAVSSASIWENQPVPPISVGLLSQYKVGSTINVPNKSINVGGRDYLAQKIVFTPNGRAYSVDSITVDQLGVYTVEYRATVDGKIYAERTSFETYNDYYTVTGEGSAQYGEETRYNTGIEGLQVSLHDGEEIRFNEVIDLRDFDHETPFIDMFATPNVLGQRDVHAFTMRLTDAYDPDNYVTIDAKSVNTDGGSNLWWMNFIFVAAGSNGNSLKGIEWGKNLVHVDNSFGFPIKYSLYGTLDNANSIGTNLFQLCYDLEENKIYGPFGKAERFAIDLDDPLYFADGWKGFTTGEVYLSLSGKGYYAPTFNFTVKRVGNGDLSKRYLYDDGKPTIQIDCEELPVAGVNNPYPVFEATAWDAYTGRIPVTKKVFFNYRGDNRYELPVTDERFVPTQRGTYTIEYSAKDGAGNVAVQTVSVVCDGEDRTLALVTGDKQTEGKTRLPVVLAQAEHTGGVGAVWMQTSVKLNGQPVTVRDGEFIPMAAGEYEVEIVASDISGQVARESYTVVVVKNDKPVIAEAILPDFMIEGRVYRIPSVTAYDEQTQTELTCSAFVNGVKVEKETYTVPSGKDILLIEYKVGEEVKAYEIPVLRYASPASLFVSDGTVGSVKDGVLIENGAFRFANELSSNFSATVNVSGGSRLTLELVDYQDKYVTATLSLASGKRTVEYAAAEQALKVDGRTVASVRFGNGVRLSGAVKGSVTVESVNGQSLRSGAAKAGDEFVVNGNYGLKIACGSSLTVFSAKRYQVLTVDEGCTVSVTAPDGEQLLVNASAGKEHSVSVDGFGVYEIAYTAGGKTIIYKIQSVDRTPPVINVGRQPAASVKLGEQFIVYDATATDDTDAETSVTCFIIAPSGMIRSVEQCTEARTEGGSIVRFVEAGEYTVRYFAVDLNGNYSVKEFTVTVTA